ncbi:MAG: hypothetical protein RLZZ623_3479 [Actinomycetota bacterium]|jgi:hypothetical protein
MNDRIRSISKWTAVLGFSATMMIAPTVLAHGDNVTAACDTGLVIALDVYDATAPNTIVVTIDGIDVVSTSFGTTFALTVPFGDPFVTHTYRVVVTAWDDLDFTHGWSFDTGVQTIPICAEASTSTSSTTTTVEVAPTSSSVVPSSVVPSSVVVPSVLPGSTVIVAQAGPTTTAGHGATLPVTGGSDGGLLTAAVVAGGLGIVATLVVRRSSRA